MSNTFYQDFTIADYFGRDAIIDTYNRALKEWQHDPEMLAGLVIALNQKIWYYYHRNNETRAELYNTLWEQAHDYALEHLKNDNLRTYLRLTD